MPCTRSEYCTVGTCVESCCRGCNCFVAENAPVVLLDKPSITTSGDKAYIRLKFGVRYDLICSKTNLLFLEAYGDITNCGSDEKELVYWGSSVKGTVAVKPDIFSAAMASVYVDGSPVYSYGGVEEKVDSIFISWSDQGGDRVIKRRIKLEVCGGKAKLILYAQDCPDKIPIDIEVWSGGRLLYGVSTFLSSSKIAEDRTIEVPAGYASYQVKLYSGWKMSTPNCRDLLLSFVVDNPSVKTELGLKINAVYVGGQRVEDGGKISVSVPTSLEVEVQSDSQRDVQVVMLWIGSTTPAVIWSGSVSGTERVSTTFMVPKTGDYSFKIYAVSGNVKSNEYAVTISVTSVPSCPEGGQLVKSSGQTCTLPDGSTGTCMSRYGEYCCCKKQESGPKFRLSVPSSVTVLYGEKKTVFVDVYNDGDEYGTAKIEISGRSVNAVYTVGVWPGSRNSVKFEITGSENETISVKAYYGSVLHDSKTVYVYVVKQTTLDFTFKVDKNRVCFKDVVTVTVSVNYLYPTTGFVYILKADRQALVYRSFTVPGPADVSFTPPEIGLQKFYVVVKIGDGYAEKEFQVDVVGCPNVKLDVPVVEYMKPCASGMVEAGFGVWVVNDGWGKASAKVVFEVGSCSTPCAHDKFVVECPSGCPEAVVQLDSFTSKYVSAAMMALGCGRTYYLRAKAIYDGKESLSKIVNFTTPSQRSDGGGDGCRCVPREMCSTYNDTCKLPDGRNGVCCTQQPCVLNVEAKVEGNLVYVTVLNYSGDATLYISKSDGGYKAVRYEGPGTAIPLAEGVWRIEARDSRGCYGQTLVNVGGATIGPTTGVDFTQTPRSELEAVTKLVVDILPLLLFLNVVSLLGE